MATKINDSIFKQFLGTIDEFKTYYNERLSEESREKLKECLVFIHDKPVTNELGETVWNNDGYIFTNGYYYTCRETNLTADVLKDLIANGSTEAAGISWKIVDGKLVFTPVIKEDLTALTKVGFVENGQTFEAGTSIEDILNAIFAKEVWYAANFTYADNLTVSMSAPALSATVDGATASSGVTYEIGAPVTVDCTMNASSYTGGDKYTVTCSTSGNNGFVKNGDTSTKLTSLDVPAAVSTSGSDSLEITSKSKCFGNVTVSSNGISSTGLNIQSGDNTLSVRSNSVSYTTTAAPTDDMKTLTTLSNKGKYYDETTKDGVSIKHTVGDSDTKTQSPTNTITLKGAYKYYYVWSAATCPTIPENFSGDLSDWTENWGTKTINPTATAMNDIAWVLKPTGTAPTIVEPTTGAVTSFETVSTHTNKYGTQYTLYRFPRTVAGIAGGANYKDMKLN